MEAFSLLKYWKTTTSKTPSTTPPTTTTTIVNDVSDDNSDTAQGGDDDGPFFDLEFAIPAEEDGESRETINEVDEHEEDEAENVQEEANLTFSPSDNDLFFKGRILQLDGSSDGNEIIDTNNKSTTGVVGQFPIPVSLAKSATKFRVFLHGLKRSKSDSSNSKTNNKKFFTVKFKVEEVPIFSLLTRATSNSKTTTTTTATSPTAAVTATVEGVEEEKVESKKEVVQKYLKKVKVLKVSKSKKETEIKEKVVGPGLKLKVIVKKHLGKTTSKSSVVHSNSTMVQQSSTSSNDTTSSKKRDDSLLQQQDGIQSAILHCKRSFNSSKDFLEGEEASSVLLTQLINESLNEKKSDKANDVVAV